MASGEAHQDQSFPIKIKFKQFTPPNSVKIGEDYLLHIEWKNRDNSQSYEGSFVLFVSLENEKLHPLDVYCVYGCNIIEGTERNNGLEYIFPSQEFLSHESGVNEITILYFRPGDFNWVLAIAET